MKYVVGLMSGTSLDGIDAALVRIGENDERKRTPLEVKLIEFVTLPFINEIRQEILSCCDEKEGTVDKICRLNFILGELSARAVHEVINRAGLKSGEIDLIGSHGQTVYHDVNSDDFISTLQIGAAGIIAERTGITTVSNFRIRDIAAGGEGAPLVPYVEYLLYRSDKEDNRVLQNLGGIGNFTYLAAGGMLPDVIGTDTGPGNMLIDGVISILTDNQLKYDKNGEWAAAGKVDQGLLEDLMKHPFINKKIPKTTGREVFGLKLARDIITKSNEKQLGKYDVIATVTAFTALSVVDAYRRFIASDINQIIIGGGGSYNKTLVKMIKRYSEELLKGNPRVLTQEELGYSGNAKEAVAFAVLAYQTMKGRKNNAPGATGAARPVILGDITPGHKFFESLNW